jgi:hypothetical protein
VKAGGRAEEGRRHHVGHGAQPGDPGGGEGDRRRTFTSCTKDIEINAEGMGWGDMDRKLQAAMAAKSPPTASHTQTYVVTSFRAKGLIEPVDDVIKAIGEDKIFPSVLRWLKYPRRQVLGHHARVGCGRSSAGRGGLRKRRRGRPAEVEDVG